MLGSNDYLRGRLMKQPQIQQGRKCTYLRSSIYSLPNNFLCLIHLREFNQITCQLCRRVPVVQLVWKGRYLASGLVDTLCSMRVLALQILLVSSAAPSAVCKNGELAVIALGSSTTPRSLLAKCQRRESELRAPLLTYRYLTPAAPQ